MMASLGYKMSSTCSFPRLTKTSMQSLYEINPEREIKPYGLPQIAGIESVLEHMTDYIIINYLPTVTLIINILNSERVDDDE